MSFIEPRRLGALAGSDSGVWLERDPGECANPASPGVELPSDPQPAGRRRQPVAPPGLRQTVS